MAARKIEYLAEINCAIGLTGNLTRNNLKRPKCVDNGVEDKRLWSCAA